MHYLNVILNSLGDLALWAFRWRNPWPAMIAASLLTTVLLLLIVRATARPAAIRRSKGRLIARVMELHLFRHDPVVGLSACRRIVAANLLYLRRMLRPLCWTLLPGILILIQLNCWFSRRPLREGESAIVEVRLIPERPALEDRLALVTSKSLAMETPPLRIPTLQQVDWRIRAREGNDGWIDVQSNGWSVRKTVAIGERLTKISDMKVRAGFWETLLHPAELPIDGESSIQSIHIRYPRRKLMIGLTEVDWVIAFLVLTVLFGAVLMGPMKTPL